MTTMMLLEWFQSISHINDSSDNESDNNEDYALTWCELSPNDISSTISSGKGKVSSGTIEEIEHVKAQFASMC